MLSHSTLTSIPEDFICDDRKSLVRADACLSTALIHTKLFFFFLFNFACYHVTTTLFTRRCLKLILWVAIVPISISLSPCARMRNSRASLSHWGSAQTCWFIHTHAHRIYRESLGLHLTLPIGLPVLCHYPFALPLQKSSSHLHYENVSFV